MLSGFDQEAKMSQFANLWRSFTCGYLEHLLNVEYPRTNLPMMIREQSGRCVQPDRRVAGPLHVHRRRLLEEAAGNDAGPVPQSAGVGRPGICRSPRFHSAASGWSGSNRAARAARLTRLPLGGVPGEIAYAGSSGGSQGGGSGGAGEWVVGRVGGPTIWNLWNQSWNCQLAPVTAPALATILQTDPQLPGFDAQDYKLPNLGGLTSDELQEISPH